MRFGKRLKSAWITGQSHFGDRILQGLKMWGTLQHVRRGVGWCEVSLYHPKAVRRADFDPEILAAAGARPRRSRSELRLESRVQLANLDTATGRRQHNEYDPDVLFSQRDGFPGTDGIPRRFCR